MDNTSWLKQAADRPLFPDLLWSRPENRKYAGKLLIIGGNSHGMGAPAIAYSAAEKAGIGICRVILPHSTQKFVGKIFPEAEFAPSTPSGSFAKEALATILDGVDWADGVLLAGDFGRNSETAILLEDFAQKYKGQLTIAQDGLDYFLTKNSLVFDRENTLPVIKFGKLQKLAQTNRPNPPIRYSMDLRQLVEVIQGWTMQSKTLFITSHAEKIIAAYDGKVSTTPVPSETNWQVELAAFASVWRLQHPKKQFEAITTAVFDYTKQK